jgi:hypothetical protein
VSLAKLDLGELIFVLFFVALPILRTIMGRNKQDASGQKKPTQSGAPTRPAPTGAPDETAGRDLWERMLRGEVPEPEAETSVPPLPQPVRDVATEVVETPWEPASVFPPPLPDEESIAEALVRENAAIADRWGEEAQVPVRLRELDSSFGGDQTESDAAYATDRRGTGSVYDLRAAIIASEVLGAPVSLRRNGVGSSTPPGLAF